MPYLNSKKRTITFNNISDEITNLTDDIICYNGSGFVGCVVSILASAKPSQTIDLNTRYLHLWMKEKDKNKIMFLKLDSDDNVVCFAIIHKIDFDPLKTQNKPHVLDYIYTYKQFRNKGYAQALINKI